MIESNYKRSHLKIKIDLHNLYYLALTIYVCLDMTIHEHSAVMLYVSLIIGALAAISTESFNKKLHSKYVVCIGLFIFFTTLSLLWTVSNAAFESAIKSIMKYGISGIVLYLNIQKKEDIDTVFLILWLAGVIMSIFSFYTYGGNYIIYAIKNGDRIGDKIFQINGFGYNAAIAFCLAYRYVLNSKKTIFRIINLFVMAPLLLCVLASGSRRSVLIVLLFLIAYTTSRKNGSSSSVKRMFVLSVIIIVAIFVYSFLSRFGFLEGIFGRFDYLSELFKTGSSSNASDEKRLFLIQQGFRYFFERPIFGHGAGSYRVMIASFYGRQIASHNNLIEILTNYGIIGFLFYYSVWFSSIKSASRYKESDIGITLLILMISVILFAEISTITHLDGILEYSIMAACVALPYVIHKEEDTKQ